MYIFASYFHTVGLILSAFIFFQLTHDSRSPAVLSSSWETWRSPWPSPSASLGFRHLPLVPSVVLQRAAFQFSTTCGNVGSRDLSDGPMGTLALEVRVSVTTLKMDLLAKEQSSENNILNLPSLIYRKLP